MNSGRGPLIAVAVALGLGLGYWAWVVKIQPERAQAAEDAKLLFKGLDPADSTEVLVRKTGSADVLLRKVEGRWRLVTPVAAPADSVAVGTLLSQLAAAKRADVVVDKGADLRDFGLDKPSGEITFKPARAGAKAAVLFFGMDSPEGNQAYGKIDGRPEVFLSDLYLKSSVLKSADDLRDKTVWSFKADDVESVRSGIGGFSLERDKQGYWRVREGSKSEPAKPGQVSAWLQSLAGLRAQSVPSETGKDGAFGLSRGKALRLSLKGGTGLTLTEGTAKAKPNGFYVQVAAQGPVFLLPEFQRMQIEKKGSALADLDAFGFDAGAATRFTVARRGHPTLTALKIAGAWSWIPAAPPKPGQPAFDFVGFLSGLAQTQLLSRLASKDLPLSPTATVSLYADGGALLERVDFGGMRGVGQVAASTTKHQVVVVPVNLLDVLPADAPTAPGPAAAAAKP